MIASATFADTVMAAGTRGFRAILGDRMNQES